MPRPGLFGALVLFVSNADSRVAEMPRLSYVGPATALREHLMQNYDASRPATPITRVGVDLRILEVLGVDASRRRLRLYVYLRLTWKDERLRWDPSEHGGLNTLPMAAGMLNESTEVWAPSVLPWKSQEPLPRALEPAYAMVHSDGSVQLSRSGALDDVSCQALGRAAPTLKELECPITVGGGFLNGNVDHHVYPLEVQPPPNTDASKAMSGYAVSSFTATTNQYSTRSRDVTPFPVVLYTVGLHLRNAPPENVDSAAVLPHQPRARQAAHLGVAADERQGAGSRRGMEHRSPHTADERSAADAPSSHAAVEAHGADREGDGDDGEGDELEGDDGAIALQGEPQLPSARANLPTAQERDADERLVELGSQRFLSTNDSEPGLVRHAMDGAVVLVGLLSFAAWARRWMAPRRTGLSRILVVGRPIARDR